MNYYNSLFLFLTLSLLATANDVHGQSWKFIKEEAGIRIFTRNEANSSLKSFKGDLTFKANPEKVCQILGNARNVDWWDDNIADLKILAFKENKFARYYFVYELPWPFSSRDLVLETRISMDTITGDRIVFSKPLDNVLAEKPGKVRITKYWQKWTIHPMDKGYVHIILEGFVDPAGNIPSWLYNPVITETPVKVMKAMRERVLSDKPAN